MEIDFQDQAKKNNEAYSCGNCKPELIFDSQPELEVHLSTFHSKNKTANVFLDSEGLYKCSFCPKTYKYKKSLVLHVIKIHGILKNVKCDSCNKSFFTAHDLKHHQSRAHLSIKRYQTKCHICNKVFSNAPPSYLKIHIKTVHEEVRKFKCDVCNKLFSRKSNLRTHKRQLHGNEKEIKKYQCDSCHKTFKLQGTLNRLSLCATKFQANSKSPIFLRLAPSNTFEERVY